MDIYILYNKKQKRPLINNCNYGSLVAFLTKEQAQAYKIGYEKEDDVEIRVQTLEKLFNIVD